MTSPAFDIDKTLAALADPYRRRTIELLHQGPKRPGELAQALRLNPPAMSRHLRVLRHCGLVEESAALMDARVRIYSLRPEPVRELRQWLSDIEQMWVDQLSAFKAHLESDEGEG